MIPFHVIGTGSTGNGVIVGENILVDAGLPFVRFEPYMDSIKLVLLTHEHGDHFKPSTVRRMAHDKPLLRFGCGPWMVRKLVNAGVATSQIDVLREKIAYNYGICNVIPVPVFHDVPNYAYKIHFPNGKVFYATDCGNLNGIVAKNYSLYLIENNYRDDELMARMDEKLANGQYPYEQRVLKYHLSEQQCNDFLASNMDYNNSEYVYLHQHIDREKNYESADCEV